MSFIIVSFDEQALCKRPIARQIDLLSLLPSYLYYLIFSVRDSYAVLGSPTMSRRWARTHQGYQSMEIGRSHGFMRHD